MADASARLESLGFHAKHIARAVERAGEEFEEALEWLLMNPLSDEERNRFLCEDIQAMGFSLEDSLEALGNNCQDLSAALSYLSERNLKKQAEIKENQRKSSVSYSDIDQKEEHYDEFKSIAEELGRLGVVSNESFHVESEESKSQQMLRKNSCTSAEEAALANIDEEAEEVKHAEELCFGGAIALKSVSSNKFLRVRPDLEISADLDQDDESCVFEILNAVNPNDISTIERHDVVPAALQASGGNWLAAEVDGSVNGRRTGPIGLFASWKIRVLNQDANADSPLLRNGDVVVLESALHHLLQVKENSTDVFAKIMNSQTPLAQWIVVIKQSKAIAKELPQATKKSCQDLWSALRVNFRLAALRIRNEEVRSYQEAAENHKKRLQARLDPVIWECLICLSNPRKTVILECGHICICQECANYVQESSQSCPVCRKPITSIVLIQD